MPKESLASIQALYLPYNIWFARNGRIFENCNLSPRMVMARVFTRADEVNITSTIKNSSIARDDWDSTLTILGS